MKINDTHVMMSIKEYTELKDKVNNLTERNANLEYVNATLNEDCWAKTREILRLKESLDRERDSVKQIMANRDNLEETIRKIKSLVFF
jgi:predicted  nucleic acid-binding Zn-ribbon protein